MTLPTKSGSVIWVGGPGGQVLIRDGEKGVWRYFTGKATQLPPGHGGEEIEVIFDAGAKANPDPNGRGEIIGVDF